MKARFPVFEIEHDGDVNASVEDLRNAGCWQIAVLSVDYDHEYMNVECQLPEGINRPEDLRLEVACL
jgi:hypothetical protein